MIKFWTIQIYHNNVGFGISYLPKCLLRSRTLPDCRLLYYFHKFIFKNIDKTDENFPLINKVELFRQKTTFKFHAVIKASNVWRYFCYKKWMQWLMVLIATFSHGMTDKTKAIDFSLMQPCFFFVVKIFHECDQILFVAVITHTQASHSNRESYYK